MNKQTEPTETELQIWLAEYKAVNQDIAAVLQRRYVLVVLNVIANATFIMNVVDFLNDREDIAVMRGKQQLFNPLEDTGAVTKTFTKAFNIAGLPVLVVLFGLGVWFRRHSRKKHIQMMFDK